MKEQLNGTNLETAIRHDEARKAGADLDDVVTSAMKQAGAGTVQDHEQRLKDLERRMDELEAKLANKWRPGD